MAELINLRLARKAKARADARQVAATNRAKHGLSKAERTRQKIDADRDARTFDGARREKED